MAMRSVIPRVRTIGFSLVVLTVIVAGALGVWRPWAPALSAAPLAAASDSIPLAPLSLPDKPRVLVFGDSWTYGFAPFDRTPGYAYVLADLIGGETIVDGVRGSGYLKPGLDGPSFGERIAALDEALVPDLVIVQGSINDRQMDADGYDAAVLAAWDALGEKYPSAGVVVLGPAPHKLPVGKATARIDRDLARLAAIRGWHYLSPIDNMWITEANYDSLIDPGLGRHHPTVEGHRYLAEHLAEYLRALAAETPVYASESIDTAQR